MGIVMIVAWVIQAGVGVALLAGWIRHARGAGRRAVTVHVVLMLSALAAWTLFALAGEVVWAWCACAILTAGIGDAVLLASARADVGDLDQACTGEFVELPIELALGRRPHVGHRHIEAFEQVVPAAGLLGEEAQGRVPKTHATIVKLDMSVMEYLTYHY